MFNLLLMEFGEYLLAPARIAGIAFIIIGLATVLISKKLARVINKQSVVDKADRTYLTILTVGFVLILAGMIVCCF